jgi:hypothetical protein
MNITVQNHGVLVLDPKFLWIPFLLLGRPQSHNDSERRGYRETFFSLFSPPLSAFARLHLHACIAPDLPPTGDSWETDSNKQTRPKENERRQKRSLPPLVFFPRHSKTAELQPLNKPIIIIIINVACAGTALQSMLCSTIEAKMIVNHDNMSS